MFVKEKRQSLFCLHGYVKFIMERGATPEGVAGGVARLLGVQVKVAHDLASSIVIDKQCTRVTCTVVVHSEQPVRALDTYHVIRRGALRFCVAIY